MVCVVLANEADRGFKNLFFKALVSKPTTGLAHEQIPVS